MIPDDYQEFPAPSYKLHRDGSRELLIFSEGKRNKNAKSSRLKGTWGCCNWCGKLMCMCCHLGMKRNAVRCICLIIALIVVILLTVLFVFLFVEYVYKGKLLLH